MSQISEKKTTVECADVGLKRELGLLSAVNFLINVIIASGIFITPGQVLAECGSVGMMFTVWAVCGVVAILAVLPFGELSAVIPKSGSIYIYLHAAFNDCHPFFGGLPSFLYFWLTFLIGSPCGGAINAKLFADYGYKILDLFVCDEILCYETAVKYFLGTSALILVGVINCLSVKLYVKSQNVLTFTKIGAILFTIGCGLYLYVTGKANKYDAGFEGTNLSLNHLMQAMYLGLYAYDGGYVICTITEEIKNPERNILYSILISLAIATSTYILLNITFLAALTPTEMASGTTVIADFAQVVFGRSGGAISAGIICICLLTSLLCSSFVNSRMGYVGAREGHIVETLCCIHKTRRTPTPAVVVQTVLTLFYFFVGGNITALIDMNSFFNWMAYGLTMVTVFIFRSRYPDAHRPFKVPSLIPILVVFLSASLVAGSLLYTPLYLLGVFAVCIFIFLSLYYIFIFKQVRFGRFEKMQKTLQKSFGLVSPLGQQKQ